MASSEKAAAMTAAPIYQSPIPPQPVGRRSTSPERQLAGAVLVMLPQQDEQSFAGFLTELTLRVIRPPCVFRIGGLNRCCHVAQHDHCSTSSRVLVNRPLVAAAAPPDLLVCAKHLSVAAMAAIVSIPFAPAAVPGPIAGAGLPGLIFAAVAFSAGGDGVGGVFEYGEWGKSPQ